MTVRTPGQFHLDMGVTRQFSFRERHYRRTSSANGGTPWAANQALTERGNRLLLHQMHRKVATFSSPALS
jgi:hypothetical protein